MNRTEQSSLVGAISTEFVPGEHQGAGNAARADTPLSESLAEAGKLLLGRQAEAGYWVYELEADVTIPAEYQLMQYFHGSVDKTIEGRIKHYILRNQLDDGSWPLYEAGGGNISATVKAYLTLKLAGVDSESTVMRKARDWVLAHGGAESVNVFTRITLAMFGQLPWHTVPAMPAEIIWFPKWWVFSLDKVSYWSRCVIVPLLIIQASRPVHQLETGKGIEELFHCNPASLRHLDKITTSNPVKSLFYLGDRIIKFLQAYIPAGLRERSIVRCEQWTREHMQGSGGIGAIYPAMANAVMALRLRGCSEDDPDYLRGQQAIEDLVVNREDETYVQPCVSPVWDTCLTLSALAEAGLDSQHVAIEKAITWLFSKQVYSKGDWARRAPRLEPGGWAFQFENNFYPDLDDTSMVIMCLLRNHAHENPEYVQRIEHAINWVKGMQNSDGGWGAFDIDNHYEYLNNIPFADHNALVDPSTADLTARCLEMFSMLGHGRGYAPIDRGLAFLKGDQESFGGWFGRWGVNYIYGTWSVLAALGALREDPKQPYIRKAINWLKEIQNEDGGWGEDCRSYEDPTLAGQGSSTPSQTAWALLGLIAIGEAGSVNVERGVQYLLKGYVPGRGWQESLYTGTGFPRVFYLRYYGYSQYFPLWALGSYAAIRQGKTTRLQYISDIMKSGVQSMHLPN